MAYEFLEDDAIADIAFKAWAGSLEETFTSAADATMNVMVEDLDSIRPREERIFELENDALDLLLFDQAVTLHRFRMEKAEQGWEAYVILDV